MVKSRADKLVHPLARAREQVRTWAQVPPKAMLAWSRSSRLGADFASRKFIMPLLSKAAVSPLTFNRMNVSRSYGLLPKAAVSPLTFNRMNVSRSYELLKNPGCFGRLFRAAE
jgi:hypothetical protein